MAVPPRKSANSSLSSKRCFRIRRSGSKPAMSTAPLPPSRNLVGPPRFGRHLHLRWLLEGFSSEPHFLATLLSEVLYIHEHRELRPPGGGLQAAASLGRAVRRAHFALYRNCPGGLSFDWMAPADLGLAAYRHHAGILLRRSAGLFIAYGH